MFIFQYLSSVYKYIIEWQEFCNLVSIILPFRWWKMKDRLAFRLIKSRLLLILSFYNRILRIVPYFFGFLILWKNGFITNFCTMISYMCYRSFWLRCMHTSRMTLNFLSFIGRLLVPPRKPWVFRLLIFLAIFSHDGRSWLNMSLLVNFWLRLLLLLLSASIDNTVIKFWWF